MCCRIKVVIHVSHNPTDRYDHMINEYYRSEKFRGKVYRISFLTLMKNNLIYFIYCMFLLYIKIYKLKCY